MSEDKGDKIGRGPMPKIEACLMHPYEDAEEVFSALREGFSGVTYGLCKNCVLNAKVFLDYQKKIEDEITLRLNTLIRGRSS